MPLEMGSRLQSLVVAEEPLDRVWQWMVDLAANIARRRETTRFYAEYEDVLVELERTLHECYFDIYADIAAACQRVSVREWVRSCSAQVILFCDGFSIREAALLAHHLDDSTVGGRTVRAIMRGYRFSCLPSDTVAWRRSLWPTSAPNRSTKDFSYAEIRPGERLPPTAFADRTVMWYPLPDHGLHQTEPRYGITPEEVFTRLAEDVSRLLESMPATTAYITGDHGYLYVPRATNRWSPPANYKKMTRGIFANTRSAPTAGLDASAREVGERWRWYRVFMIADEMALLLGRYWITHAGGPRACHGGLSLPECLVPVLELTLE